MPFAVKTQESWTKAGTKLADEIEPGSRHVTHLTEPATQRTHDASCPISTLNNVIGNLKDALHADKSIYRTIPGRECDGGLVLVARYHVSSSL